MRKTAILICAATLSLNAFAQVSEQDFREPPQQARPNTFWEWMNGNITKEGITKDLEYMKAAGYGSAMMFNAGVGIARGPVDYDSPQWHEAVIHSMKEAERLGLKLMMHNSPGYTGTGGPWISVENSMKELVWAETCVISDGRTAVETDLPRPASKLGFYRDASWTGPKSPTAFSGISAAPTATCSTKTTWSVSARGPRATG